MIAYQKGDFCGTISIIHYASATKIRKNAGINLQFFADFILALLVKKIKDIM